LVVCGGCDEMGFSVKKARKEWVIKEETEGRIKSAYYLNFRD
jgi:hypothetical protein